MAKWTRESVNVWLNKNRLYGHLADAQFLGAKHRHNWQCLFGHEFPRTFDSIRSRKRFCLSCVAKHYSEEIVRFVFQELFDEAFPKTRPEWLRDRQSGNRLELDGYCEALALAFEYDGKQHRERNPSIQPTQADFVDLQRRDREKDSLCEANGVTLIRLNDEQHPKDFEQHILNAVVAANLALDARTPVDLSRYNGANQYGWLKKAEQYAQSHDGELLSDEVTTIHQKLEFRCSKHPDQPIVKSMAVIGSQKGRAWCVKCGVIRAHQKQKLSYTAKELDEVGQQFKPPIRQLGWAGTNAKDEYLWQCSSELGHFPFTKAYGAIRRAVREDKHVCPECNGKRRIKIWNMHEHAERMGGQCLTFDELEQGGKSAVSFSCHNEDHPTFQLTAAQVRNNQDAWCDQCQSNEKVKRYTTNHVSALCHENGFELMSDYSNNHTPLEAECGACGHRVVHNFRWMQAHDQKGDWCDVCRENASV